MDQTVSANEPEVHQLRFNGSAGEYFRIWIVNIALTIVTLGIYSAWAKVRTKKYLYGNIELAGSRFDYHADPVKILKGRLLVGGIFLCYALGGKISPFISVVFLCLFWALFPWILVRAMMFALSNTSYRGIRFGFDKDYHGSYVAYFKGLVISVFTLFIAAPYAAKLHYVFRLTRSKFGNQHFHFDAPTGYFFKIFYAGYALMLVGFPFMFAVMGSAIFMHKGSGNSTAAVATILGVLFLYAGIIVGGAYIRTRLFNLDANNTTLGPVQFRSGLTVMGMAGLYLTNLIGCLLTLGLAIPWAVVRSYRYRIERTQVIAPVGAIDSFQADAQSGYVSAAADAAVDFWDIDLGF